MRQYLDALKTILHDGELQSNRTGVKTITYPHIMIRHDMSKGFPLLTTKKMAWKSIKVELEFFIKGLTDKNWLKERGCHIWDEWCNPQKVPEGMSDKERKQFQIQENDLGKVYGYQWRQFNSSNKDQLRRVIDTLKSNPEDRRMLCSAWNPCEEEEQALPPCHVLWHVFVVNNKLHLCWFQRSCDFFLGVPFNLASYALLLHLLCKESKFQEGTLTGFLSNCHIYENHLDGVKTQLDREPYLLPHIITSEFKSILSWQYSDTTLIDYSHYDPIRAIIAV